MNPFQTCPEVLEEIWKNSEADADIIPKLLEQIMLYPQDDSLMTIAKETGLQLYTSIPQHEKAEKINLMVNLFLFREKPGN